MVSSIDKVVERAKEAAAWLAAAPTATKNEALTAMADEMARAASTIVEANRADLSRAQSAGFPGAFVKRLTVSESKMSSMVAGLRDVVSLDDPVGNVLESWIRPDGLLIRKVSVPFGVVGIIYESRPEVTSDAAALCFKSGNAAVLRGGSESRETNLAIVSALQQGLRNAGAPAGCIQYVVDPDRSVVNRMLKMRGKIDLLIPRGGESLIQAVVQNASVPVIETGTGNCHIYVHEDADLDMAAAVIVNAKCSYPAVCNAVETILVDSSVADRILPSLAESLRGRGVELRGCERTRAIVPGIIPATEPDWETEYLDLILAIKVVDGFEQAVRHIGRYGTKHSEAIITRNAEVAAKFQQAVDAACVYVNSSTRFTDGGQFGFGAEIGISTQKLHARGPMGLRELTTYKYLIDGEGQIRTS